ncbi:hypothetical protein L6303_04260 [archaeon]|nr:hypothetical protein [archaeon]
MELPTPYSLLLNPQLQILFFVAGIYFFLWGFFSMKGEYDVDIEVKKLDAAKRIIKRVEDFDEVNKKYNVLDENVKLQLLQDAKDLIKQN